MKAIHLGGWVYYIDEHAEQIDKDRCGKWMYFFSDLGRAEKVCREAVEEGIVTQAKHSEELGVDGQGVCCFYLDGDDIEAHKRVIRFFLRNDMIQKTKTGRLYNISFKYDNQTRAGEYGKQFEGRIRLDRFLDLTTGEWKL